MRKIIFDFDGTLIDSRQRLYLLFSSLVLESKLTFEQYWELKSGGAGHKEILRNMFNFSDQQFNSFQQLWMNQIESDEYLELDKPFELTEDLLVLLNKLGYELFLLTARQFPLKVESQLNKFGWSKYFSKVLVTKQIESKKNLLLENNIQSGVLMMVGDTGNDITTANELGIFSIAVLSGFQSQETLAKYNPRLILPGVKDICKLNFKNFIDNENSIS